MAGKENEYPGMDDNLKNEVNDRRTDKGVLYNTKNVEDEKTLRKIKNKRFKDEDEDANNKFITDIEKYIKANNNNNTDLKILQTLINVYQPENNTASQRDAANRADARNEPFHAGKSKTRKNKSKKSKTKRSKKSKTKRSKKSKTRKNKSKKSKTKRSKKSKTKRTKK
jgi:hypothetical protein